MRNAEIDSLGIKIGGKMLSDLRYADIKGKNSLKYEDIELKVKGTALGKVPDIKYLGSIKSADGTCIKDIKARIAMGESKIKHLERSQYPPSAENKTP